MSFFSVTYSVSDIRTFRLQTCKEANTDLHVQSCRLVHTSGVHCHMCASSTSGCACTVQYCTAPCSTGSLFQAQDVWKQEGR